MSSSVEVSDQSIRSGRRTASWIVLTAMAVFATVIGVSVLFVTDDPFPRDAGVLIASFAVLGGVLALAVVLGPYRRGERWAWNTLWIYPAFLVSHVVALGTVIPDAVLAVIVAIALILGRPARTSRDA